MPVPLNAFVDIVKVWLTESLGYLVNDSVPVKPNYKQGPTPSDIDLICKHPHNHKQKVTIGSGRRLNLNPNLLVECKGWFDYSKTEFIKQLEEDLKVVMDGKGKVRLSHPLLKLQGDSFNNKK